MARRQSRVLALRALFAVEVGRQDPAEAMREAMSDEPEAFAAYARDIVAGVVGRREEIDERIARLSRGWALPRLAAVDRCLLRMAAWELLTQPGIPANAIVSEAVELASTYSTEQAPRFVNGLLASLAAEVGRPLEERGAPRGKREADDGPDR